MNKTKEQLEVIERISKAFARHMIDNNREYHADNIYLGLYGFINKFDPEHNQELIKDNVVRYMFNNADKLGLKEKLGKDNQFYLVSKEAD